MKQNTPLRRKRELRHSMINDRTEKPGTEKPGTEKPGTEKSEAEKPGTEKLHVTKSKSRKRAVTIIAVILSVILVLTAALAINGTCPYRNQEADAEYLTWMSELDDDLLLRDIVIPGSHDAGTYEMPWLGRTQNYSVAAQLTFGVRYFDLRVNKTEDGYPIYHTILNGTDFTEILSQIKEFILAHPGEVLILDFQHFKGDSSADVQLMLEKALREEDLVVRNDTDLSDAEFIRSLTLGDARGKCLVFFGETGDDPSDWIFLRNNDDCSRTDTALDSCYIGEYHKSGFEALVTEAHPLYFEKLRAAREAGTDGIFVLQCQLTDGRLIFGPWSMERGQEEQMDEYVRNLREGEYGEDLNVIMRDFLTPAKCADIIALNK